MVYNGKPYKNGWFGGATIFGNIQMLVQGTKYITLETTRCPLVFMEAMIQSHGSGDGVPLP